MKLQASNIDIYEEQANCDAHGGFIRKTHTLPAGTKVSTSCPECLKDNNDEGEEFNRIEEQRRRDGYIAARLRGACIPPRFQSKSFGDYIADCDKSTKVLNTCKRYADGFDKVKELGISIILHGNIGAGKTHLACAIANKLAYDGYSSHYTTIGKAIGAVKDTYRNSSKKGEIEVITDYSKPDLLILDEVGVQYGTDAEKNILFAIINARYEAVKPTIMISNLDMDGLTKYAGERVIDRMKEGRGLTLVFDWSSRRSVK